MSLSKTMQKQLCSRVAEPGATKKQLFQAVSKTKNSNHRIDALLAAVSDMCKLVRNEK